MNDSFYILIFIADIFLMVLAISKWNIHPFISILACSVLLGSIMGIPIQDIPDLINEGFSSIFRSIGMVIIFGALIGSVLDISGAARKMADVIIRPIGKEHPETALMLMGWIVSIPVFCDSCFVVLDPIRKSLIRKTKKSSTGCTIGLSLGSILAHCLIPPTPGPLAAAESIYQGIGLRINVTQIILFGIFCSILPLIVIAFFARHVGKFVQTEHETIEPDKELSAPRAGSSAFLSFLPIIVPIGLMAAYSILGQDPIIHFLGDPVIALGVGFLFSLLLLQRVGKMDQLYELTENTLTTVGPILFVTAAGSILGEVISRTPITAMIGKYAPSLQQMGLFFPFFLAVLLKTALGSSTVAMTVSAEIMAPIIPVLGLSNSSRAALVVMAIASGSIIVSHTNDSFFWVVTRFGGMNIKEGHKTQTLGSFVTGISAFLNVLLLSRILCDF